MFILKKLHLTEYILFLVVGLSFCIFVNLFNFIKLKKDPSSPNPKIYKNVSIWSPDNIYYLTPPENLLKGNGWKISYIRDEPAPGYGAYYRRTPFYSLIYLLFRVAFEEQKAIFALIVFQILLFLISIICIYKILIWVLPQNILLSKLFTLLYASIPWFYSYSFFTVPEGVYPYISIYFLYFVIKGNKSKCLKDKTKMFIVASLLLSLNILTRPLSGIIGLILLVAFIESYRSLPFYKISKYAVLISLTPLILISTWALRNYSINKEIVILEKTSHPNNLERLKPDFDAFYNFTKCWGEDGYYFNLYQAPLERAAIEGDTSGLYVKNVLLKWPSFVVNYFGVKRLYDAIRQYQYSLFCQRYNYKNNLSMDDEFTQEQLAVANTFGILEKEFKRKFPFKFYFVSPLIYLKDLLFNSRTGNIYLFQSNKQSNVFILTFKTFFLLFNSAIGVCALLGFWFYINDKFHLTVFYIVPFISIAFFIFYFKSIEQRYILQIFPYMFLNSAIIFDKSYIKFIKPLLKSSSN